MSVDERLLVIDTATSHVVAAVAAPDGAVAERRAWLAGHRHGETLLPAISELLGGRDPRSAGIVGVIVGTGPGAFTGLRVGLATAKGIARALGVPIVGIPTVDALADAAAAAHGIDRAAVLVVLPAGPSDRIACRTGEPPELIVGPDGPDLRPGEVACAVDLDGRASHAAARVGRTAIEGLPDALAALGSRRLADGHADDLAGLVPEYVTLPRGVRSMSGEVAWSRTLA